MTNPLVATVKNDFNPMFIRLNSYLIESSERGRKTSLLCPQSQRRHPGSLQCQKIGDILRGPT